MWRLLVNTIVVTVVAFQCHLLLMPKQRFEVFSFGIGTGAVRGVFSSSCRDNAVIQSPARNIFSTAVRRLPRLSSSSRTYILNETAHHEHDEEKKRDFNGSIKEKVDKRTRDYKSTVYDHTKENRTSTMHDHSKENRASIPESPSSMTKQEQDIFYVQSLGAITGRGEFASKQQKQSAERVIDRLEALNPTIQPVYDTSKLYGRWELVYCSTQLFRSSPFFMAGRALCKTNIQKLRYNWFCDMHRKALAISRIGAVRQIITTNNKLVSEFEVTVGAIPFLGAVTPIRYSGGLPVTIEGSLVSTADYIPAFNGTAMELMMDTVQIKGSNIPVLRQLLDRYFKFQSRTLGAIMEEYLSYNNPKPIIRTTYLDDCIRINRDQDRNIFVYVKTSQDGRLTDYSTVDADLGLLELMKGFNDAITRVYI